MTFLALLERFFQLNPGTRTDGFLTRKPGFAKSVLDSIERYFKLVAYRDFGLTFLVAYDVSGEGKEVRCEGENLGVRG